MDTSKAASGQRVIGRPWPKGVSGNPGGYHKGSRHKVTLAMEALFDGEAERLGRKCIDAALADPPDMLALRMCLERIFPPRKERSIQIEGMPKVRDAEQRARLWRV